MIVLILLEIRAVPAEPRRPRVNPRVVKRKMSNFPTKARAKAAPPTPSPTGDGSLIEIVAPACPVSPSHPPGTSTHQTSRPTPKLQTPDFWAAHIRAWRASKLSRKLYCQQHKLNQRSFNYWLDRRRLSARPAKPQGDNQGQQPA